MAEAIENHRTDGPDIFDDGLINALTVRFALTRLNPPQREIIGLVDIAGFSYAEAAALLAAFSLGTALPAAAQDDDYDLLPEGEGHDEVYGICSGCHSIKLMVPQGLSRDS